MSQGHEKREVAVGEWGSGGEAHRDSSDGCLARGRSEATDHGAVEVRRGGKGDEQRIARSPIVGCDGIGPA